MVSTSKSLPGRICRKMSAALALGVSRMSTRTIVRPLRPSGTNLPFWVSVYFVKCRGMALGRVAAPVDDEVGPVLDFAQRARHLATQLGGDLGGPCQSEVWLSITPPISSASATASRWASQVTLLSP